MNSNLGAAGRYTLDKMLIADFDRLEQKALTGHGTDGHGNPTVGGDGYDNMAISETTVFDTIRKDFNMLTPEKKKEAIAKLYAENSSKMPKEVLLKYALEVIPQTRIIAALEPLLATINHNEYEETVFELLENMAAAMDTNIKKRKFEQAISNVIVDYLPE